MEGLRIIHYTPIVGRRDAHALAFPKSEILHLLRSRFKRDSLSRLLRYHKDIMTEKEQSSGNKDEKEKRGEKRIGLRIKC